MSLPNSLGFCNYCGQERSAGTSLFKCSRCHGVLYCDREHQKSDWPRHKLLCTQINGNNRNSHNAPTTVEILKPSDSLSTTTSHVMNNVSDSLTVPTGLRKSSSQHLLQDEMLSSVTTKSSPKIYEIQPVQPVFYVVTNPDLLATPNTSGIAVNCPVTASQGNPKFSSSWSDSTLMGASGSVRRNFLREVSSFPTRISHPTKFSHSENLPLNLLSLQCCESETVNSIRVKTSVRHVAQSLTRFGWSVMDNFLGDYHGNRLLTEIAKLYDVGKFSDGQLMRFREGSSAKQIRSDKIMWWDGRKEDSPEIHFLVTMMDAVIVGCSPSLTQCRISGRSRAMIACYPGNGTHYVTHVDNPDKDGRCVTAIYYLNPNWQAEDGGSLKLYAESASDPVEISPLFDRLLLFWSDRRNPHEVLPVFRNRFAITVWYYDAIEKAAALEREGHEFNQKNVVDKRFSTLAPTINPQKNLEKHQVVVAPIPLSHPKESHTSVIQHNHTGVCPLETTIVGGINKTQKSTDMER